MVHVSELWSPEGLSPRQVRHIEYAADIVRRPTSSIHLESSFGHRLPPLTRLSDSAFDVPIAATRERPLTLELSRRPGRAAVRVQLDL